MTTIELTINNAQSNSNRVLAGEGAGQDVQEKRSVRSDSVSRTGSNWKLDTGTGNVRTGDWVEPHDGGDRSGPAKISPCDTPTTTPATVYEPDPGTIHTLPHSYDRDCRCVDCVAHERMLGGNSGIFKSFK